MINFSLSNHDIDINKFEQEWYELAREICLNIYQGPQIQELKKHLQEEGFLSLEEKSVFINICDKVKYDLIFQKYGPEGSEGYQRFSDAWKEWFRAKGVESKKGKAQKTIVGHIMFGSTPSPVEFLTKFEEEFK